MPPVVNPHPVLPFVFASLVLAGCTGEPGDSSPKSPQVPAKKPSVEPGAQKKPATPKKPPLEKRQYGGRRLADWVEDLNTIDPKGPAGAAAVDGLIALVRDVDVPLPTRIRAAVTMGRVGRRAEKSVPVFVEFLKQRAEPRDPNRHAELMFSLKALTMLGPTAKSATPELIRLVRNSDWTVYVRAAAMEALARIGPADPKAVAAIISMLTYRGDEGVSIADRLFLRRFAADAIAIIGPDAYIAIPRLRTCLRDNDPEVRRRAALALGAMKGKGRDGIGLLVDALLRDPSNDVKDAAADALALLGPLALPELRKLMKVDDAEAKARAALSLGKIGPPAKDALPDLDFALDDDDGWVRINSAEAIWLISGNVDKAAAAMVEELRNPNRQIRIKAYRFFKKLGPKAKSAEIALQRLLENKRGEVRTAASKALQAVRAKR
jgi:HEAT repeat protein